MLMHVLNLWQFHILSPISEITKPLHDIYISRVSPVFRGITVKDEYKYKTHFYFLKTMYNLLLLMKMHFHVLVYDIKSQ